MVELPSTSYPLAIGFDSFFSSEPHRCKVWAPNLAPSPFLVGALVWYMVSHGYIRMPE